MKISTVTKTLKTALYTSGICMTIGAIWITILMIHQISLNNIISVKPKIIETEKIIEKEVIIEKEIEKIVIVESHVLQNLIDKEYKNVSILISHNNNTMLYLLAYSFKDDTRITKSFADRYDFLDYVNTLLPEVIGKK